VDSAGANLADAWRCTVSPSLLHEALLQLFRDRPELSVQLLRDALGVRVPEYTTVTDGSADMSQIAPAEYRADHVLLARSGEKPVLGIVVEAQLARNDRKRFSWPLYAVDLRARLECPCCVLVITPNEDVARWASRPIDIGPGGCINVFVLGPKQVPEVRDLAQSRREPELAVLSAVAHSRSRSPGKAAELALAALYGCLGLDADRATFYADIIRAALNESARKALEALMESPKNREYQSEFVRKHFSAGRVEGKAEAVLAILEARGLSVSADERARIFASGNDAELDRWLRRAVTIGSAAELFAH